MLIVGISGKKRSGKDETADTIINALEGGFGIAFADALKLEVANACKVSLPELEANKPKFRGLLQHWGTEFRREFCGNQNYWIDQVAKKLAQLEVHYRYAVITDVRFKIEYEFVRRNGGILIRIESNRCNLIDQHASETELDDAQFDYTIRNDGTLDDFRANITRIATKVIAQRL